MVTFHQETQAVVTVGVIEMEKGRAKGFGIVEVDTEARIPYKGSSLTIRYHGIDYELSIERSLSLRAVFISQTKERVNVHVMEE